MGLAFFTIALAQAPQIMMGQPIHTEPQSRPRFDVACDLRDLDSAKSYRVVFAQYGGVYIKRPGESYGAREPTYVRFSRDDLGIFGTAEMDMTGNQITDWYSDGPFELTAKKGARGGYTFYKTAGRQASFTSPAKVAVTVRGGRFVRNVPPDQSVKEFLLTGTCDVSWKRQEAVLTGALKNETKR